MTPLDTRYEKLLGLAILGGLLFLLALPPMGIAGLALICFVPLIYVIHRSNISIAAVSGFLFGIVAYICIPLSLLPWGWDVPIYAVLISGTFFTLLAVFTKWISSVPVIGSTWIAFPLAYAILQLLGESVLSVPVLISVIYPVDLIDGSGIFGAIGGRGVDYMICGINAAIAGLLLDRNRNTQGALLFVAAIVILLIFFVTLHFVKSYKYVLAQKTLNVIAIDNNMSFERVRKLAYSIDQKRSMTEELDSMTRQAIEMNPDLILWPEGGNGLANSQIPSRKKAFMSLTHTGNYRLIAGSKYILTDGSEYNVADYIVNGSFTDQVQKKYRVPIIESALTPGNNGTFDILGDKIGVGICFDIAFPQTVADMLAHGAQALVILSNDASFGYSGLTYMHLRYAAIRALENSREIVFLSNTGPSVLISQSGRKKSGYIHTPTPSSQQHHLQMNTGNTFYTRYPGLTGLVVLTLLTLYLIVIRKLCLLQK